MSESAVAAPPASATHPSWCDPAWCRDTRLEPDSDFHEVIHAAMLLDEGDVWVGLHLNESSNHAELWVVGAEDAPPDQTGRIAAALASAAQLLAARATSRPHDYQQ